MYRGSVDSSESPLDFGNCLNDSYYFEESPEGSINIDDEPYTDNEQDHNAKPCWHDQVYAKQQEIAAWSRNLS